MEKKSRKKKVLITLLIIFIVISVAVWFVVFKMLKPKDLGVKISKEAYESAKAKLNYDTGNPSGDGETKKLLKVDTKLTSEELTSFLSYDKPSTYPLKNVQIKVNKDDTMEFSGVVSTEYFLKNMLDGKTDEKDILEAVPALKYLPDKLVVYANISGGVENNSSDISVKKVSVMGITLPEKLYKTEDAKGSIDDVINSYFNKLGYYEMFKVQDGELVLKGDIPPGIIIPD